MSFLRSTVLSLALLVSCAHSEPVWHGDTAFNQSERDTIETANVFMAANLSKDPYEIVWDAPHVRFCGGEHQIIRGGGGLNPLVDNGLWVPSQKCIYLDPTAKPLVTTVAHEIGHSYGLKHLPADVPGIMNPVTGPFVWTDADEVACIVWLVCPPQ